MAQRGCARTQWRFAGVKELKKVEVYYPSQVDVQAWQHGYHEKSKPDAWPYGLNQIAGDASVSYLKIERQRSLGAAVAAVLPTRHDPHRAESSPCSVRSVTWDERTALDLYLAKGQAPYATGVIWATDQLRRPAEFPRTMLLRRLLGQSQLLWCLSTAQLHVLDKWLGLRSKGKSARFLPFGIDTDFYSLRPYESNNLIVSVGGDRDRDPRTLFAALADVRRAKPEVQAIVQTTSTLKPPKGVSVVKRLSHVELRELYARATVIAVATKPNLHVSGMTVSLEAASTGRPVVITKTPGMTDYVVEGQTGLLAPVGDSKAMAQRILEILQVPGKAEEMGNAGRLHAQRNHTSAAMAANLRSMLEAGASW